MEHKNKMTPTLEQIEEYVKQEGFHFNPYEFFKYYEDADPPWTYYDKSGKQKPVRNWKQKARMVWERIALSQPKKKCWCGKPGCYPAGHDDTGQAYFRCIDHKPNFKPSLPKEMTEGVLKTVREEESVSNRVNFNLHKLRAVK